MRRRGEAGEATEGPSQLDLRRCPATTWLAEGRPISLVQKAMGHSSVRVTEGFEHVVDKDLPPLVAEQEGRGLRGLAADG